VGREYLEIYSLTKILEENKMEPIFRHLGMRYVFIYLGATFMNLTGTLNPR